VNQVVVLVFVLVVDKVSEMVFASRPAVPVVLQVWLVVIATQLEGRLARLDDLLTGHVGLRVLLFDFLFGFGLIVLADGTLVWGIIEQVHCKRLELGQNVSCPWNSLVVLQRFVVFCV
jgi:hypothetical protein